MFWLWALSVAGALAGVRVEDPHDCLEAEAVDLEVRSALGDALVDRIDLLARIVPRADGLRLSLEVSEGGARVWDREIDVWPVDCPFLPALVARSVERGLSALPGWQLATPSRRLPSEIGLALSATLPQFLQLGLGGVASVGLRRPLRWDFDLEGSLSTFAAVGSGRYQLVGARLGTGPSFEWPSRSGAVRVSLRGGAGPVAVVGRGFTVENVTRTLPRASALLEVGWVGQLRVSGRLELPAPRVVAVDEGNLARRAEPGLRVGLVLGIAGRVR